MIAILTTIINNPVVKTVAIAAATEAAKRVVKIMEGKLAAAR